MPEAHYFAALAKAQPLNLFADPNMRIMGQTIISRERQVVLFYQVLEEQYYLYIQRSATDYNADPYDMEDHWSDEEIIEDFLNVSARELEVQRILNRGDTR